MGQYYTPFGGIKYHMAALFSVREKRQQQLRCDLSVQHPLISNGLPYHGNNISDMNRREDATTMLFLIQLDFHSRKLLNIITWGKQQAIIKNATILSSVKITSIMENDIRIFGTTNSDFFADLVCDIMTLKMKL